MRTSTAYFAGVGTVVVAVAAGLGGGYLAANIVSPPVQTVSKLERRMSAEPIPVSTAPAEPVTYATAPAATNSPPAPAQEQQQAKPQAQPQPQAEAAAPAANAPHSEEKTADNVAAVQPAQSHPQPSKPAEQADEKTTASREARTSDVDMKRAAAERRRAERRQQWTDKRRWKQPREQEVDVIEERVREVTEPRRIRIREEGEPREFGERRRRDIFAEPVRSEMPRIRLFGQDD
ncbi:hypothetical protein GWE18_23635 [Bradyrhizobium sp. CSA112]|uniref:hypothetical protein n=1 Tax=Bradyrhizobium sp. CSA112 TaxID=2699170 RepID=UPI0023AFD84E|nr:hypothetical protein [Bradyrhizobium sp. CSA112]MDE5455775.1 hypothetical protein [Bradyrhizobium sp. CSA112]